MPNAKIEKPEELRHWRVHLGPSTNLWFYRVLAILHHLGVGLSRFFRVEDACNCNPRKQNHDRKTMLCVTTIVCFRPQVPYDCVHDSRGLEGFRSPVCSGFGHRLFFVPSLAANHGKGCSLVSQAPVHCDRRCQTRPQNIVLFTHTPRGCSPVSWVIEAPYVFLLTRLYIEQSVFDFLHYCLYIPFIHLLRTPASNLSEPCCPRARDRV